jgi:TonB-linked SusC/RagA family outer membrane protein
MKKIYPKKWTYRLLSPLIPNLKMSCLFIATFIMLQAPLQAKDALTEIKVSVNANHTPVKKVLRALEVQSGMKFVYLSNQVDEHRKVSIEVWNAPLNSVLNNLFAGTGIEYESLGKQILLKKKTLKISRGDDEQDETPVIFSVTVSGTVTDESAQPLPGVNVLEKGTVNGTNTDQNGSYKLEVQDENAVLVFSFIGYASQEVTVGNQSQVSITLEPDVKSLQEVVVVGYGEQKKENLTGAVATVDAKQLDSRPLANLGQGLQGLVPNLNVNVNNGKPGTGASYNIRGITSINNANGLGGPLIMVDGVQMDPNLINPGDVESITVLKDAASAAIYGSRAAFGVILITTRNAKKNSPLRINYSGSYTLTNPTKLPKYLNSVDFINMFREADRTGQISGGQTASQPFTVQDSIMAANYFADPKNNPTGYQDPGDPSRYRYVGNTDWVDVLYSDWAPQTQHNISVSGGSEKTSFIGSLGYFNQKGTLKPADEVYQRLNPILKITTDATPWLSLNFKTALNHIRNDEPNSGVTTQRSWILNDSRPNMPVFNPGGVYYAGQGNFTNPVALMKLSGRNTLTANDLWLTGGAELTPVKNVKVNANYTFNNYSGFEQRVQKQYTEYGFNDVALGYYPWTFPNTTAEISYNNNYEALNLYANYDHALDRHAFKVTVGYNQEKRHYKRLNTAAKNLINPNIPFIGLNADPKPSIGGSEQEWALNGLLYRLNYSFNDKYLLEINGRYDGSSVYASGHRFVWSPSVSAGWRISEEGFFQPVQDVINTLKLRASYGKLPNQYFNPAEPSSGTAYPYIALLPTSTSNYIFGSQQSIVVGAPGLVREDFTWESVITKDIGLDFSLLKQKLTGSFDWYIRDTKNMLVDGQPLPAVLGTAAPKRNAADLRTKGWEFNVTWSDKIGSDINYSMRLGLSDYTATITKYDLNPSGSIGSYYVGQKYNEIWGFVTEGFFQTDDEAQSADQSNIYAGTLLAGDVKYKDLDGDDRITRGNNTLSDPGDRKIIGNSTPRYQFGFNLTVQYKNFDFALFFQGVARRDYMPDDNAFLGFRSEWNVPFVYSKDHWTPDNQGAYFPRLRFGNGGNMETQTKYLQNAAYARLKNISLGYTIPSDVLERVKIQNVRFYVTGQNLFTITSLFDAYDPETIGFGTYPLSRAVSFGVQVGL